jgi:hypothetical protein
VYFRKHGGGGGGQRHEFHQQNIFKIIKYIGKIQSLDGTYTGDNNGDNIDTFEPSPDDLKETDDNNINANKKY